MPPVLPLENENTRCEKSATAKRYLSILCDSPVCPSLLDYRDIFTATLLCAADGCVDCNAFYREMRFLKMLTYECGAAHLLRGLLNSVIDGRMSVPPTRAKSLISYAEGEAASGCPDCTAIIDVLYEIGKQKKSTDIPMIDWLADINRTLFRPLFSEIRLKPTNKVL